MAPGKLLQTTGEVLLVGCVVALGAIRFTPVTWFPYDWLLALGLLAVGAGLLVVGKTVQRHSAGVRNKTRANDAV